MDTTENNEIAFTLDMLLSLQAGIEKLESWQSAVWGYWEAIKRLGGGGANVNAAKKEVAARLKKYK